MDELKAELEQLRTQLASLTEQSAAAAAATARVAELEAQLDEARTALEAVKGEALTLKTSLDETAAKLDAAQGELSVIAAEKAATAAEATYQARLASLPEAYRSALEKRGEEAQEKFAARWRAATDEQWSEFAEEIAATFSLIKPSYLQMTQAEGGEIPTGGSAGSVRSLLRNSK